MRLRLTILAQNISTSMPKRIIGPKKPQRQTNLPSGLAAPSIDNKGFLERRGFQLTSLTPDLVRGARNAASQGDLGPLQELYEKMETSETFFGGLVSVLKSGVGSMDISVSPGRGLTVEEQQMADEFAVMLDDQMTILDTPQLSKLFLDGYFRGVRLIEVEYELIDYPYNRTYAMITDYTPVAPSRLRWETAYTRGDWGELLIKTHDIQRGRPVSDFPTGKILTSIERHERGRYDLMGAARRCVPWFLLKVFAQGWWADYAEIYGKPIRIARYPKSSSGATLDTIEQFLQRLGEDAYGMFPEGVKVDLIEANRGGNISTFEDIIDKCNQEISVALVGQSETSLAPGEGGAGARAAVLSNIRREVLKELTQYVARGWRQIAESLVKLNYGDNFAIRRLLPQIGVDISSTSEKEAEFARAERMVESGMPVRLEDFYEASGYQKPDRGDIVIMDGKITHFRGADETTLTEEGEIDLSSNQDEGQDESSGEDSPDEDGQDSGSEGDGEESNDPEDRDRADEEIERRSSN